MDTDRQQVPGDVGKTGTVVSVHGPAARRETNTKKYAHKMTELPGV